tara:strand:- start:333 stop:641 length:309 start_codon:yes stop_codon:yes gene_type:complete
MVKGKLYKVANLDKNKQNNYLVSFRYGVRNGGMGWLWTDNLVQPPDTSIFKNGDVFVCLGKKEVQKGIAQFYGIDTWYEALGPDGKIHKFTPSMRSSYFRNP